MLEHVQQLRREQLHLTRGVVVLRQATRVPALHPRQQHERQSRPEVNRHRRERRGSLRVGVRRDRRRRPTHEQREEDADEIDREVARQVRTAREHAGEDVEAVVIARLLVRVRRVVERVHAAPELLDHRLVAVHGVFVVHLIAQREVRVERAHRDEHHREPPLRPARRAGERLGRQVPRDEHREHREDRRDEQPEIEALEQPRGGRHRGEEQPEREGDRQRARRERRQRPRGDARTHEATRREPESDERDQPERDRGEVQEAASTTRGVDADSGTIPVPRHEFSLCQPIVTSSRFNAENQDLNSFSRM